MTRKLTTKTCGHRDAVWNQRVEYVHRSQQHREGTTSVRWLCVDCRDASIARVKGGQYVLVEAIEQLAEYLKDPDEETWRSLQRKMEPFLAEQEALF